MAFDAVDDNLFINQNQLRVGDVNNLVNSIKELSPLYWAAAGDLAVGLEENRFRQLSAATADDMYLTHLGDEVGWEDTSFLRTNALTTRGRSANAAFSLIRIGNDGVQLERSNNGVTSTLRTPTTIQMYSHNSSVLDVRRVNNSLYLYTAYPMNYAITCRLLRASDAAGTPGLRAVFGNVAGLPEEGTEFSGVQFIEASGMTESFFVLLDLVSFLARNPAWDRWSAECSVTCRWL